MSKPRKSKRYEYNLHSVLKVRLIHEKQEQDKFTAAVRQLEEEEKKEKELIDLQQAAYLKLRELMSGVMTNLNEITLRKHHLDILKEKIIEQKEVVRQAEEKKEQQRLALVKATMDKKIIEKDKEKKKLAWKKLMDKEDNKFLDDISSIGFEMKRRKRLSEMPEHEQ